jgi:hypothetical protein
VLKHQQVDFDTLQKETVYIKNCVRDLYFASLNNFSGLVPKTK